MVSVIRKFLFRFGDRWIAKDGFGLAAAFAFYTLFSIAPMIAFAIALSAYFLGVEGAREGVTRWLESFIEEERATNLVELVYMEEWTDLNWFYTGVTGLFFLWGSSIAFLRLRIAVNILLGVEMGSIKKAIRNSVRGRLLSIVFTISAGLLMALFIVVIGSTRLVTWLADALGGPSDYIVQAMAFSFASFLAFSIVRFLPTYGPSWRASALAAVFIMITFDVGRRIFEYQVSNSEVFSAYGAANTLVIFLLWIFYVAQALLLGVNLAATLDEAFAGRFSAENEDTGKRGSHAR